MLHSSSCNNQFEFFTDHEIPETQVDFNAIKNITISGDVVEVTPVFNAYWYFATERQNIFYKRISRSNAHQFTNDPILSCFKFTNSYRASDRVSQYLIKNVIYRDDLPCNNEEVFYRILLFKLFNKIETWEALEREIGQLTLSNYNYSDFDDVLSSLKNKGSAIYSAAYIMPSAGSVFGKKMKHQNHLNLLEFMLKNEFPKKLSSLRSMKEAYNLMLSAPSIGPFLAYQFVTDVNYSEVTGFSEDEFVMAGPGALDGISKCFGNIKRFKPEQIILHMYEFQNHYFDKLGLDFKSLWGRSLQLIDCQNLFCEISKYSRVAFPDVDGVSGRTRIKQKYVPGKTVNMPWYPPKWGINEKI